FTGSSRSLGCQGARPGNAESSCRVMRFMAELPGGGLMKSRPPSYDQMSYDEQRLWDRREREREDLDYELDCAKRDADDAAHAARRKERELRSSMSERDEA